MTPMPLYPGVPGMGKDLAAKDRYRLCSRNRYRSVEYLAVFVTGSCCFHNNILDNN